MRQIRLSLNIIHFTPSQSPNVEEERRFCQCFERIRTGLTFLEMICKCMKWMEFSSLRSSDQKWICLSSGVLQGACDCLIKPVKMEALKVFWQHVVRKKINNTLERLEQPRRKEEDKLHLENSCIVSCTVSGNAGHPMTLKRKIDGEDEGKASDGLSTGKK
ncbi:hypothetical protein POPTR_014G125400v4 [Populus trichocarpa]|uniref:Uncharacterized protein n=1 Tax=Populus trichocarpa TaxID=3694 RepID=A0ACC0RZM5_POPTR|nr:hypothetical protein BDE02_14G104600 [Populus trichocarpa]KAI9382357.1 hypothetical protein POPTR_014G125400v4 [Populus trichocarpa]